MSHYRDNLPFFSARNETEFEETYMSMEESLFMLLGLLFYQNNYSVREVRSFLKELYCICNKLNGKRNTLYVYGPPNSGKNYFFDALASFFLNPGYIINPSRYERFPFMGGLNRRINIWNEARLDPYFNEDMKQIMGGDQLEVQVKNHAPRILHKTPLIVLSNRQVFPVTDTAFNVRYTRYNWSSCSFLRRSGGLRPHPFAAGLLCLWAKDVLVLDDGQTLEYSKLNKIVDYIVNKKEILYKDLWQVSWYKV